MGQIFEYIKIALMNIRGNKGRSVLTMLGIIIGISSVIMIITTGNGIKNSVNSELSSMVGSQLSFDSHGKNEDGIYVEFTVEDLEEIVAVDEHVEYAYTTMYFGGEATGRKGTFSSICIYGQPDSIHENKEPIVKGRFYNKNDYYQGSRVCIIRESSAKLLFGNTDVLGMTLEVTMFGYPVELEIIGVREDPEVNGILAMFVDNSRVELEAPETIVFELIGQEIGHDYFYVGVDAPENCDQVAKNVLRMLENKYNCRGKKVITVLNYGDYLSETGQVLDYITIFVVLVAAISLLVGGIGVMNIMLVSVTERTREIGIRKALGARTSSILLQFLSESAIITLLGGVIGIAIGIGGAYLICSVAGFTAKVSVASVLGASAFSAGVGIFFGIYPARKAARLSPIEALRHE